MSHLTPRSIVGAALLVALVSGTASAQNSPGADPVDVLTQYLLKQKLIELPKTTASDKQVSAPEGLILGVTDYWGQVTALEM